MGVLITDYTTLGAQAAGSTNRLLDGTREVIAVLLTKKGMQTSANSLKQWWRTKS